MEKEHQSEIYNMFVQSLKDKKSNERYATELQVWSQKLMTEGIIEKNIFDCNSIAEFNIFESKLKNSEQYINYRTERKDKTRILIQDL